MISKATELLLIYQCVYKEEGHIKQINPKEDRLDRLETAVQQVSEQLTALSTQGRPLNLSWKPPRTRRFKDIECYNWKKRAFSQKLLAFGKRPRGHLHRPSGRCSQIPVSARTIDCLPALSPLHSKAIKTACVVGKMNNCDTQILLDSGASCSVMQADRTLLADLVKSDTITLINTGGRKLIPLGTATAKLDLGIITVDHTLVVVKHLSIAVILGCDFLTTNGVILDFKANTFHTANSALQGNLLLQSPQSCMLILDDEYPQAMPSKAANDSLDMPTDNHPALRQVLQDNAMIFRKDLGRTTVTEHVIETGEASPVKIAARPIIWNVFIISYKRWHKKASLGAATALGVPQLFIFRKAMVKFEYALTLSNKVTKKCLCST